MVKPDDVDDIQAQVIARDIAKQIEEELTYPGQIRITVVRESPRAPSTLPRDDADRPGTAVRSCPASQRADVLRCGPTAAR